MAPGGTFDSVHLLLAGVLQVDAKTAKGFWIDFEALIAFVIVNTPSFPFLLLSLGDDTPTNK